MKKLLCIASLAIIFLCGSCKEKVTDGQLISEIELISPEQVYDAVHGDDMVQIVDVRTSDEYVVSHLKGAQNICVTSSDFKEKVKDLDKDKPVYLYCKKGGRSAKAASIMKELGFTKVYDMDGGLTNWEGQGLETVQVP